MDILKSLNENQREAVKCLKNSQIVVAGAGSGKTKVLTHKIAYLIEQGYEPSSILALTFTNKAAKEMKDRIKKLIGKKADGIWMGTFHSIFAKILRIDAVKLGYKPNFSIYDRDDSVALVSHVMQALDISTDLFTPNAAQHRISNMKNHMVTPDEFRKNFADSSADEKFANIYEEYNNRLFENNAMDFDDLLLKPIQLFEKYPKIAAHYRGNFRYILVDEYQDTNRAQYELVKMMTSQRIKVCVVGDDAQSIYGWRGADISNMLDFQKDFPNSKLFKLEQNYRSTANILKGANSVIVNNKNQIEKNLWTEQPEGDRITVIRCSDEKDEAFHIAKNIKKEVQKRKITLNDVAILYRTNSQSRALEDALRREKLPYQIVGGVEFYRRKEVKDILAYLRVLANQNDEESLLRIMNFPQRGIGNTSVEKMLAFSRRLDISFFTTMGRIFEVIEVKERIQKNVKQFKILLDKYIDLTEKLSLYELTSALVDELGVLRMYKEENSKDSLARYQNVQELLNAIQDFTKTNKDATIDDFLAEVSLVSGVDQMKDEANFVTLMTIHSAKGLEFPVVFLSGLEEDLFPINRKFDTDADIEEERRLFYVAFTRAKEKLYLTYARSRYRFGEVAYQDRSRFIDEVDPEVLDEAKAATARSGRKRKSYYDDLYKGVADPDADKRSYRVGSRVTHKIFGTGKIMSIDGSGDMAKITIQFESHGMKTLVAKFANLTLV
jgi:DNA helicase-2/ATP-dependent DNA helicase PcrA